MSVHWGVVPAQPDEPGFREWLTSAALEIPAMSGRFPTLDEFMGAIQSFEGLPIQQETLGESLYRISLGEPYSEQWACILGQVGDDRFQFHFDGSGNREITMMAILKSLAGVCGPFILYESIAATPVIIESSTNVEQAREDWRKRIRKQYSENMAE